MLSEADIVGVQRAIEGLLRDVERADEMAVIVRRGEPRLFASYGVPESDDEEEEEEEEGTGLLGLNRLQRLSAQVKNRGVVGKGKGKDKARGKDAGTGRGFSWSPSPTPPPGSPVPNVLKQEYDNLDRTTWRDLEAFHYGMRWMTKLDVPAADEGMNAQFEARPNIGASIGNASDCGSGTLAGYLTDGKGNTYAMTCHHIIKLDADSVWPTPSDYLKGCKVVAPAQQDLYVTTKTHGHEIDGLVHEAVGAHLRGDIDLAGRLSARGRKTMAAHDVRVKLMEGGGALFGTVVGSGWRIAHTKNGAWLMDQVVFKPVSSRIGTNVFTYTGRDNKEGKRYRLEARGWTDLPLGAEVLKLGRTTSLTKGFVADVRLCVGTERTRGNRTKRYWEIQAGIITAGAGPWFSEPGDSGAWVLRSPGFADMLAWDLRRRCGRVAADPIPAPVGGMMFGGADSVDGISLTFFNPARLLRRFLGKMVDGGENLVPGVAEELPPPVPLESTWAEEERWSRQSREAGEAWEVFADRNFLAHQVQRFGDLHIFREPRWQEELQERMRVQERAEKGKGVRRKGRDDVGADEVVATGGSARARRGLRKVAPRTPRRRGTSEEVPDTPTPVHERDPGSADGATGRMAESRPTPESPTKRRMLKTRAPSTLQTPRRRPRDTLASSGVKARERVRRPPPTVTDEV
ncbi:hypothetical protein DRE_07711 [Drechslerella stenobrocha 248]|uniref:Uncharacterized protein n=1 Tax=Drechslerella stenobrocha 248 TaxID=1043628 RepID=W7HK57_9PEZI|nr:hypothetical protein DRE_07711 [Drechslerella stenobrocha 248]